MIIIESIFPNGATEKLWNLSLQYYNQNMRQELNSFSHTLSDEHNLSHGINNHQLDSDTQTKEDIQHLERCRKQVHLFYEENPGGHLLT